MTLATRPALPKLSPKLSLLLSLLLSLPLAACEGEDKPSDDDSGAADGATDGTTDGTADGATDGATDGSDGGEPELPTIDGATLSPEAAIVGDTLTCTPGATADPLGAAVEVLFAWEVDGVLTDDVDDTFVAPARGSSVRCGAIPRAEARVGETAWAGPLVISNAPPTVAAAELSPIPATTLDPLDCAALEPADLDGDAIEPVCAWTIDGAPLSDASDAACTLPAGRAPKGSAVACILEMTDGVDFSAPVTSPVLTIDNAAPTVSDHRLSPDPAGAGDTLTATWAEADVDGDPLSAEHRWEVNGLPLGTTEAWLAPGAFSRGDTVTHTVTVSDGEASAASSLSLIIENTAPEAPEAELLPLPARAGGRDLVCGLSAESYDLDGDLVTYTVAWTVDGVPVTSGLWTDQLPNDTVPGALLVQGQTWICSLIPDDGLSVGPPATAETTVRAAMPNLIIDGAAQTLAPGAYQYAVVEIINGGVLEISGLVEIMADEVTLDALSTIDGAALGWGAGSGPGAGAASVDSGAGGGGNGGVGGRGGYDAGDTPGVGGVEVGDATSQLIWAGSGGGSTSDGLGGAGGAALTFFAETIVLEGLIDLSGGAGRSGGRSTGGGAGGGLLLVCDTAELSGEVLLNGGAGGPGTSTANDSGGGGGGGRFKLLYGSSYVLDGTVEVEGGVGGIYGTAAGSTAGAPGTEHVAVRPWP